MARPERNNVDYFPHPVSHGRKMYYLDRKYQNDGYTVWFRTLEELGRADFHYLDLRDDTQLMYLSSRCNVSEQLYLEIIGVLVKFGDFDRWLWERHRIIWNQKFVDSIQEAYKKRANDCITKPKLLEKLKPGFRGEETPIKEEETPIKEEKTQFPREKGVSNPQRKEKKSKEEKSKVKGIYSHIFLLSELKSSDDLDQYEKIAFSFWKLIRDNMGKYGIKSSDISKAKYKNWVDPVRLAFTQDKRTKEEFAEIYQFLKSEIPAGDFAWSRTILSTGSLRKNFEKVLLKARSVKVKIKEERTYRKEKTENYTPSEPSPTAMTADEYRKQKTTKETLVPNKIGQKK